MRCYSSSQTNFFAWHQYLDPFCFATSHISVCDLHLIPPYWHNILATKGVIPRTVFLVFYTDQIAAMLTFLLDMPWTSRLHIWAESIPLPAHDPLIHSVRSLQPSFWSNKRYICWVTYFATSSSYILYRYFGQNTIWYLHSYNECASFLNWRVIMYLLKASHLLGTYIILAATV